MINIDCVTSKLDGFSRGFPVQDDGVPLRGRGRGLQVQLEPWRCRNQSLISQTPKAGSSLVEGFLCTPEKNVYSWCSFLGMYLTYIGISKRPCRHPESYETTIYKFNICSIMFNRYFIYLYYNGPRAKKKQKIAGSTGWSCHTAALTLRPRFVPITLQAKCAKSCPLEAQVLHGVDDSLFMATQCYTCHGINYSGLYTIVWAWLKYIRKLTHTILMILVILVIDQEMELSEIMGQNLECIIHPLWGVNKS